MAIDTTMHNVSFPIQSSSRSIYERTAGVVFGLPLDITKVSYIILSTIELLLNCRSVFLPLDRHLPTF